MRVVWTDEAVGHLVEIHDYLARNSEDQARRLVDRITRRSEQIESLPLSGQMVPEYERKDVREVWETPYRIIYRLMTDRIDVLAVIHGARRLPPIP